MDAWMFPLGDELYHHTVSQPVLFINTETFHWKKNIRQINELLKNETGTLINCDDGVMFSLLMFNRAFFQVIIIILFHS